jgi:hypothetical protein
VFKIDSKGFYDDFQFPNLTDEEYEFFKNYVTSEKGIVDILESWMCHESFDLWFAILMKKFRYHKLMLASSNKEITE